MAKGHPDLPKKVAAVVLKKSEIFAALKRIDANGAARERVLRMETSFRRKVAAHLLGLPAKDAKLRKFNTSPFVLLFHARNQGYTRVSQIEKDIIPAKVFSSMETSAGRMVEEVVLPAYGWEVVPSEMHSPESVLDGRKEQNGKRFLCATLKSGPRCLNDEMAKDIGNDVVQHALSWSRTHSATKVEFTYGVLYGTKRQSNKKDWHVLRNIAQGLSASSTLIDSHVGAWGLRYSDGNLEVSATVRVGLEWWEYLGGPDAWVEVCVALIRACVDPAHAIREESPAYKISDLDVILDTSMKPKGFNVALLQESQLEWLMFLAAHFCDSLES